MKELCIEDYAAIVAIDWADQKHDVCEIDLATGTTGTTESIVISSKPESIQDWAVQL